MVDNIQKSPSRMTVLRHHLRKNWLRYTAGLLFCLCVGELIYIQHLSKGLVRVSNDPYDIRFSGLIYKSPELWDDAHQSFLRNAEPVPIHSHNDNERHIPLFDALGSGCISVEADVHLRRSSLLVGHSSLSLSSKKTLESLYLEPLQRMIKAQNAGLTGQWRGLFDKAPKQTLTLLVDFKSSGAKSFAELDRHLQPLRDLNYLTYWNGTARITRPLTIVVSGNAPFESVIGMNSTHRDIFWDAKLERLVSTEDNFETNPPTYRFNQSNSYFASTRFRNAKLFRSDYESSLDVLPGRERDMTSTQIQQAKSRGLLARYWDTPSAPPNLQIFHACADILDIRQMFELCLINKDFYEMGMEAIFESDILQDAVFWDPVRGTKVFYERISDDESFTYPCLLDGYSDSEDDEDDELPRYFKAQSPLAEDSDNDTDREFIPSNEFCVRYLTARTLTKIRQKLPTQDHIVLKVIAEYMKQYKLDHNASCNTTIEEEVQAVCEVAVKYGYIYDRHDFFIGEPMWDDGIPMSCRNETCAVVRDGLVAMAIYLDEPDILRTILSKEQSVACPDHLGDKENINKSSDEEVQRMAPFTPWLPYVDRIGANIKLGFNPPECGRSLARLAHSARMVVQIDNMNCATILLDSLSGDSREQDLVRQEIIAESKTVERLKWLRFAVTCGPSLTEYTIVLPGLTHELDWLGRTDYSGRKYAAVELSKILDTTTSVEIFDVAYDAIMKGFTDREGVWWTKTSHRHFYAAHTLASWGTARIHRAVLDDCMPLVKRLVRLGYHLGPTHSAKDLENENFKTLVDSEKPRDISLQLATSREDLEMVKLLFDIGAERNRKNVRKAMRVAMEQGNLAILQILVKRGNPEGLLNQKHKRLWRQGFAEKGHQDMLPWVELM
ncbi:altered inheritance of mitochondria 6 [Fusarium sporotrichioides]|uniref:Altered inheritance of mitochondria protein 6 n=1 Tax=Fusarium sporotrichioides TaxID=5514 RepID=A0A395S0X2_FUSSP|nr:altered inheritance of mitochondria 6 [Fusarium sporotrichioides]